jgi:hypothetical protein
MNGELIADRGGNRALAPGDASRDLFVGWATGRLIEPELLHLDAQGTGKALGCRLAGPSTAEFPSSQRVDRHAYPSGDGRLREGGRGELGLLLAKLADAAHLPSLAMPRAT